MLPGIIQSIFFKKKELSQNKEENSAKQIFARIKDLIMKRPWLFVGFSASLLLLISTQIRAVLIVLGLIILAIISKMPQLIFPFVVVLDLILFVVVILTIAYGPFIAIACGLIAYYIGTIIHAQFKYIIPETYVIPPIGYICVAILVLFLPFGVVTTGIIATLAYSILMLLLYWFSLHNLFNEITFAVTCIPFNYWLFTKFGEKALALLGA